MPIFAGGFYIIAVMIRQRRRPRRASVRLGHSEKSYEEEAEEDENEDEDGVEGSIEMESVCSNRGKTNLVAGAVRLPSVSGNRTTGAGSGEPQRQRRVYDGSVNALSSYGSGGSGGSASEALRSVVVSSHQAHRRLRQEETGANGDREAARGARKKQPRSSSYPDDHRAVAYAIQRPAD